MSLETYPTCGNSENVMQKCMFFPAWESKTMDSGRTFEICSCLKAFLCPVGTCALPIKMCALITLLGRLWVLLPTESNVRCDVFSAGTRRYFQKKASGGKYSFSAENADCRGRRICLINIVEENDLILHCLVLS